MTTLNKFFNTQKPGIAFYGEVISDGKFIKLSK